MRNFFKGISWSQIGAGALAAVTSFLLSAKIGIAGSVIGVAIGSMVSAVASQIYQNVLKASSKKIQDVTPFIGSGNGSGRESANQGADAVTSGAQTTNTAVIANDADITRVLSSEDDQHGQGLESAETPAPRVVTSNRASTASADAAAATTANSGKQHPGREAKAVSALRNAREHAAQTGTDARHRRKVAAIVAVVSALLAVALTAAIIMLVTEGKGTDSVVRDLVNKSQNQQTPEPVPSVTADQGGSWDGSSSPTPSESSSEAPSQSSSPTASATPSPTGSDNGTGTSTGSGSPSPSSSPATSGSDGSGSTGTPSSGSGSSGSGASGSGKGSQGSSGSGSGSGSGSSDGTANAGGAGSGSGSSSGGSGSGSVKK
ncbi:hypothetical protein [Bifidobacterium sp.]|uniref:hypothetical protein n=1 Tax=Bifidobacterium sp. TaxID=41200 RepID=UPI0025C4BF2A|nr:hypothetical protein [Bifidobacterium sp.]MCH4209247.1 hypothetical protein [Bifidobacterium sp.]MCI1224642.1 hypothetical protein [Bifidobacterium sp.]